MNSFSNCNTSCIKNCTIVDAVPSCPLKIVSLVFIILGIILIFLLIIIAYEVYGCYKTKQGYLRIKTKFIFYQFKQVSNKQELSVVQNREYGKVSKDDQLVQGQLLINDQDFE
ncbi:hypothetical protein SS50377_24835 [Spironucleus salmonicida]|uniref:Transmembrane protein n=1 Tax=Spironucleus salmonicida TaxID=348837 RepID=V6M0Z0_9EUKA|nr:hypothetical protein SS50377_24835 [Spironucleus salmonicida]|eukprot:EST46824.1 Hypothetical protein SS50377_13154 [Spironucleus salmonicida]